MTTSDEKQLAEAVIRWASEELNIPTAKTNDGKPVFNHFVDMCKGTELRKLWKFGLGNIRNEKYVENAREKMELHEILEKLEDLKSENLKKEKKLNRTKENIHELEEKLKLNRGEMYEAQLHISKLKREVDLNDAKCYELKDHVTAIGEKMEVVKVQKQKCDKVVMEIDDRASNLSEERRDLELLACQKEMESILKEIKAHVDSGISGIPKHEENLKITWKNLNEIRVKFLALLIKEAWINITRQETKALVENEEASVSKEDAIFEILKAFSIDIEDFKDDVTEKPLVTMSRILQWKHGNALKEYETIEEYKKQIAQNNSKIISLENIFKDQSPNLKGHLDLVGLRAYKKSLEASTQQLKKDNDLRAPIQKKITAMRSEIRDYNRRFATNKHLITSFSKQSTEYIQTIPKDQALASNKADVMVTGLISDNAQLFEHHIAELNKEEKLFLHSKESDLFKTKVDGKLVPIWDLSINRPLYQSYSLGNDAYQNISRKMELPVFSPPSYLFQKVCEAKLKLLNPKLPGEVSDRVSVLSGQLSATSDKLSAFFLKYQAEMTGFKIKGESILKIAKEKNLPLFDETLNVYINEPALKLIEK